MKPLNYTPGKFNKQQQTKLGKALWDFLNQDNIVIRMETASELKRPAVEAIATRLEDKFGLRLAFDLTIESDKREHRRFKQMIGDMIRQILEARGYAKGQQNVVLRVHSIYSPDKLMFSRGTRYNWPKNTPPAN